jgi:signal transduction histidine kinase
LLSLLAAALAVAAGGVLLASRDVTERQLADRASLHAFASSLQAELVRLDALYERHVRDLAFAINDANTVTTQRLCQKLEGVKSCSLLRAHDLESPIHIRVEGTGSKVPVATFKPIMLSSDLVMSSDRVWSADPDASDSGWEATAYAAYSIYWQRRSPQLAVAFTIDIHEIAAITRKHIQVWTEGHFAPVMAQHGLAQLRAPDNTILAQSEDMTESRTPDFVAPLSSRWGLWQVQAWDRLISRTVYHEPTLYGAAILSSVLALLGVMLSRSQSRTQILAEQRVSFVNRVSHELGTPLTNMLLNLDLTRELVDHHPEEAKRRLTLAEEETRRLTRLTANVLTFSHRERNTLQLHPVACLPSEVLKQTLDHFMPALERRGIAVETTFQEQERVLVDVDALAQIIANLISNVEKYAASGGWLRLESAWSNDQLVVKVSDRGPGIPTQDRERLFKPFERLTNHLNEGTTGTGLGLTIARDLAERMGGTLTIDHEGNKNILVLQIPAPSAVLEQKAAQSLPAQFEPNPA